MRHLLLYPFIACCLLFVQPCSAKNVDLEKADYLYNHLAFHKAIRYYERIADSLVPQQEFVRIGDCYRLTGGLSKAAYWYAKAVGLQNCKDEVKLHYAQLLMQLMRYDDAQKWLEEYSRNNPNDKRAANLVAGCNAASQLDAKTITPAVLLGFNTDRSEFAPTLWKGNLVFMTDTLIAVNKKTDSWSGNSYYGLYYVLADTNGNVGGGCNKVTAGKELNIKYHTGPCAFSGGGDTMYFARSKYQRQFLNNRSVSNKDGTVLLEIMIASGYDEKEKRFKSVTPFLYNSVNYSVSSVAVSPDGSKLIFSSDMPGGKGGSDLYICYKGEKGGWTNPENIGGMINTEGEEVYPYFVDNATLSFSSDGLNGYGGLDIYTAQWDEESQSFSSPVNAGAPLNSSYDDMSLAMFPGGKKAYFSSSRPAARGGDNIYYYEKKEPVPVVANLEPVEVARVPLVEKKEIPKIEERPPLKTNKVYTVKGFYFPVNKADVMAESMGEMDNVLIEMQENIKMKIQLLAYTDCHGTGAHNQDLSEKRAASVKKFLVSRGIAEDRISSKGLGVEKGQCTPCNTCSKEQLQRSRRVDFVVVEQ